MIIVMTVKIGIPIWKIVRVIKEKVHLHFTPPLGCGGKTK
jgi:hypothetical protein